jgi:NhaP-type Na+/H+ or K+/H+ antiporter
MRSEPLRCRTQAFLLQLFTLATAFVIGLGIKHLNIHWIHEAGATILLGVLVGLMISGSSVSDEITDWLDFDESVFFFLLLPPIIFEGGYSLRTKPFLSNFGAICGLAFAGTTISTFAIGFFVWICGGMGICYGLPLLHALVFGALISATDPVTVLAIFQELGVNTELYSLVFGESVLNDAVAIVLYRTLVNFNNKGVTFVSLIESAGFFLVIFVGIPRGGGAVRGERHALLQAAQQARRARRARHFAAEVLARGDGAGDDRALCGVRGC